MSNRMQKQFLQMFDNIKDSFAEIESKQFFQDYLNQLIPNFQKESVIQNFQIVFKELFKIDKINKQVYQQRLALMLFLISLFQRILDPDLYSHLKLFLYQTLLKDLLDYYFHLDYVVCNIEKSIGMDFYPENLYVYTNSIYCIIVLYGETERLFGLTESQKLNVKTQIIQKLKENYFLESFPPIYILDLIREVRDIFKEEIESLLARKSLQNDKSNIDDTLFGEIRKYYFESIQNKENEISNFYKELLYQNSVSIIAKEIKKGHISQLMYQKDIELQSYLKQKNLNSDDFDKRQQFISIKIDEIFFNKKYSDNELIQPNQQDDIRISVNQFKDDFNSQQNSESLPFSDQQPKKSQQFFQKNLHEISIDESQNQSQLQSQQNLSKFESVNDQQQSKQNSQHLQIPNAFSEFNSQMSSQLQQKEPQIKTTNLKNKKKRIFGSFGQNQQNSDGKKLSIFEQFQNDSNQNILKDSSISQNKKSFNFQSFKKRPSTQRVSQNNSQIIQSKKQMFTKDSTTNNNQKFSEYFTQEAPSLKQSQLNIPNRSSLIGRNSQLISSKNNHQKNVQVSFTNSRVSFRRPQNPSTNLKNHKTIINQALNQQKQISPKANPKINNFVSNVQVSNQQKILNKDNVFQQQKDVKVQIKQDNSNEFLKNKKTINSFHQHTKGKALSPIKSKKDIMKEFDFKKVEKKETFNDSEFFSEKDQIIKIQKTPNEITRNQSITGSIKFNNQQENDLLKEIVLLKEKNQDLQEKNEMLLQTLRNTEQIHQKQEQKLNEHIIELKESQQGYQQQIEQYQQITQQQEIINQEKQKNLDEEIKIQREEVLKDQQQNQQKQIDDIKEQYQKQIDDLKEKYQREIDNLKVENQQNIFDLQQKQKEELKKNLMENESLQIQLRDQSQVFKDQLNREQQERKLQQQQLIQENNKKLNKLVEENQNIKLKLEINQFQNQMLQSQEIDFSEEEKQIRINLINSFKKKFHDFKLTAQKQLKEFFLYFSKQQFKLLHQFKYNLKDLLKNNKVIIQQDQYNKQDKQVQQYDTNLIKLKILQLKELSNQIKNDNSQNIKILKIFVKEKIKNLSKSEKQKFQQKIKKKEQIFKKELDIQYQDRIKNTQRLVQIEQKLLESEKFEKNELIKQVELLKNKINNQGEKNNELESQNYSLRQQLVLFKENPQLKQLQDTILNLEQENTELQNLCNDLQQQIYELSQKKYQEVFNLPKVQYNNQNKSKTVPQISIPTLTSIDQRKKQKTQIRYQTESNTNRDRIGSYKGTQFIKKCEMLLNIDDNQKQLQNKKGNKNQKFNQGEILKSTTINMLIEKEYLLYKKYDLEIFCEEKVKKKDDYYSIDLFFTFENSSQNRILIYNIDLCCQSNNLKIQKSKTQKNFEIRSYEKIELNFHLIASEGYIIDLQPIKLDYRVSYKDQSQREKQNCVIPLTINKFLIYSKDQIENLQVIQQIPTQFEQQIYKPLPDIYEKILPNLQNMSKSIKGVKIRSIYGSFFVLLNQTSDVINLIQIKAMNKNFVIDEYIEFIKHIFDN